MKKIRIQKYRARKGYCGKGKETGKVQKNAHKGNRRSKETSK